MPKWKVLISKRFKVLHNYIRQKKSYLCSVKGTEFPYRYMGFMEFGNIKLNA